MLHRLFRRGAGKRPAETPQVARTDRLYAVGDIHGRDDLLAAMIDRLTDDAAQMSDPRKARFIFLGDYIDRGDHSAEVLQRLGALQASDSRFEFLMGNHEAAMLAFLKDPVAGADWIDWGGRQTLASYGVAGASRAPDHDELRDLHAALSVKARDHIRFLQSLGRYAMSGDVVFAHASLDPTVPLDAQPDATLLWGQLPEGKVSGLPGRRLVHGHFADYAPVTRAERICVDTGAYYSGRLTAVRLDEQESFLHVDVQDLMG